MKNESENNVQNVCNLQYLTEMMGGKKHLIKGIMDEFLTQIPDELQSINDAITRTDYASIKNFAHTMKSSTSIMSISVLTPVLEEMEDFGARAMAIEEIIRLNHKLNLICGQAMAEIESLKHNYV